MIGAFESIRKCLTDVKTRGLVNHMPAKEKNCFFELKDELKKPAFNCEECTGKSKVKITLLGGEILPSGYTQVTSNLIIIIYSIDGVAVEELESMLRTNYVPKNS